MIWIHRALVTAALLGLALATLYAVRAVTGRPHRARRAFRAAVPAYALLVADALGRIPVVLASAESTGSPRSMGWASVDLVLRNGLPVILWGAALLGRWRGWLADTVFAAAVIIAAIATLVFYLLPLPGRGAPI
jgi:hypothetical protein